MKTKLSVALLLLGMGLSGCRYQLNNTIAQPDVRKDNTVVYGKGPDSAAAQLNNKYPENPDATQQAENFRQKWSATAATATSGTASADSTSGAQ